MIGKDIPFALLSALAVLCAACNKEDHVRWGGGSLSTTHIELAVDSACVQAPNVITPDGDGINEAFFVFSKNVVSLEVRIKDSANELVIEFTDPNFGWNGADSTGIGPYTVEVRATSTSGISLFGKSSLTILEYGNGSCLNYEGTPVTGDQLDPRICGISHPSHEVFCE